MKCFVCFYLLAEREYNSRYIIILYLFMSLIGRAGESEVKKISYKTLSHHHQYRKNNRNKKILAESFSIFDVVGREFR